MNNTLHFFGDSWFAEYSELEWVYDQQVGNLDVKYDFSYTNQFIDRSKYKPLDQKPIGCAELVSDKLNMKYINYARNGSSIDSMLDRLLDAELQPGDHAVFALTAPARRMYFNEYKSAVDLSANNDVEQINDYNHSWITAVHCFAIYSYCLQYNVTPWFVSTFNVVSYFSESYHPLWDQITDSNWILPRDQCVVQEYDADYFSSSSNDKFQYRNSDWTEWLQSNNQQVVQYIRPCWDHPNQQGRELLATLIANKITRYIK